MEMPEPQVAVGHLREIKEEMTRSGVQILLGEHQRKAKKQENQSAVS